MTGANEVREPLLLVEHLTMRFGGLTAVHDLSFDAYSREITAIIGPNGGDLAGIGIEQIGRAHV